ncbi:MAG: FTR1 family iron permease [Clostridia bacterium]|nr:FTR1 family iron permease [Clostridia bacterium]
MKCKKIAAVLLALLLFAAVPLTAFAAEDTVVLTWEEYAAAHGIETRNWNTVADAVDLVIDHAVACYEAGDMEEALTYAKATYWGYYETTGFERNTLTYISGSRVSLVELQFSAFRKAVKKENNIDAVREEGQKLSDYLHEDALILSPDVENNVEEGASAGSAAATFVGSFTIILREGLEAILVVGAIIAYLIKTGNKKGVIPVYIGAAFAVVCSFGMAFLLSFLKKVSAENAMSQEIIEGVAALLAVAVLFYVSNWMVSKSESAVWSQYIEDKVAGGASRGSMITLGFTAWLAVFREGAEVILFYQPLMQESNANMVWAGFGVGCIALVIVFLAIRLLSVRLPLKPFFLATSILMAIMSICFLGSGIKELIEGGVINAAYHDWFPLNDVLDVFGIYPLYETLIPQAILLAITVVTFVIQIRRNKKKRLALETKAAADSE